MARFVATAEQYLVLSPGDAELTRWLAEARGYVALSGAITVDTPCPQTQRSSSSKAWYVPATSRSRRRCTMSVHDSLTPQQAATFQREILLAEAREAMTRGHWQAGKDAAAAAHRIQPDDRESGEILCDAVLAEAAKLFRSGEARSREGQ